jgi:SRSO17 transposase
MTGKEVLEMAEALEAHLATYDEFVGRRENREHLRRFARGQLGPIERKSLEPIADADGINPRRLQFFFSEYDWDEDSARDRHQQEIARLHGRPDGIFLVDETSDAKKGEFTAGVARQYCGETGKIDNCIVSVHLGYAAGDFHALLDGDLFLPETWNPNPDNSTIQEKRRRARIPDDVVHESKPTLALRQLKRALANGVPGGFVTADENYGGKPWWRREVDALSLVYVVEVPKSTRGWTQRRRDKLARGKTMEVLASRARHFRCQEWERFCVHDTEKGPDVWEVKKAPLWEQSENAPPVVQQMLVCRSVRTQEIKYFLTNAKASVPVKTLLRVAFSRSRVERCFQDCKSQLGLNHAELRTYQGLHRHFILTAINYHFLQKWLIEHKGGKKRRLDGEPVR